MPIGELVGVSEGSRYDRLRRRGLGVTADANIGTSCMYHAKNEPESWKIKHRDIHLFLGNEVLHLTHDGRDKQTDGSIRPE